MEETKAYCNNCCGERRHEILHKETSKWKEDLDHNDFIYGEDTYDMIKCCGCENIALRHQSWFSEDRDESGQPRIDENLYRNATVLGIYLDRSRSSVDHSWNYWGMESRRISGGDVVV